MPPRFRLLPFLFSFALASLPLQAFAGDFGYPFWQIAKSDCRRIAWNELSEDCKMPLPKIEGADYEKYKSNTLYRRVYSVLWGATYDYGWDSGFGTHEWVDIATSEGTPILAIGEGTVVSAGPLSGWWNAVTVKHTLGDKTVIFSNYAHLSSINVRKGDIVSKWQVIGWVGNTGNSYGNHLHFQIDITDQSHPYYFSTCAKWLDPMKVVNQGKCRDYLLANTIDPILFLETGNVSTVAPSRTFIDKIKDTPPVMINPSTIRSRQEILDEEAAEYLKKYSVKVDLPNTGINLTIGNTYWTNISVTDPKGVPAKGNLPEAGLVIGYDTNGLQIMPSTIVALDGGNRSVGITAKRPGTYEITFSLGKTVLETRRIFVIGKWEIIEPANVEIRVPKMLTLASETDVYLAPKSKFWSYVTTPYDTRFKVTVLKGKAKFCNLSHTTKTECDPNLVMESFEFGYEDSYNGYFKGKIVALDFAPVSFQVTRVGESKPVGITRKDLTVKNPSSLTKANPYYASTIAALKKNWQPVKNGFVFESYGVDTNKAESMISRMLSYRVLKAGNNAFMKKEARKRLESFKSEIKSQSFKTLTRGEFADLLLKSLAITDIKNPTYKNPYLDQNGSYKETLSILRSEFGFSWQDQFGDRYFQPDKTITVEEALYLMGQVVRE